MGVIFTILVLLLFLSFSLLRTLRLISGDDPFFSMITLSDDSMTEVELGKFNYRFALKKIDPTIGVIEANYVQWDKGSSKKRTPIELVDCGMV